MLGDTKVKIKHDSSPSTLVYDCDTLAVTRIVIFAIWPKNGQRRP